MRLSSAARPTVDDAIPRNRVVQQVSAILLGGFACDPRQAEHVTVEKEQLGCRRSAQPRGVLDDGVQDRPGVGDVAAERREDFAAGRRLLARVATPVERVSRRAGVRSFGSASQSCHVVPCAGRAINRTDDP